MSTFLTDYRAHAAERAALGIPPLPLEAKQVAEQLNEDALNNRYAHLVLIADPTTLGRIRPLLHKETQSRLLADIAKDLTNAPLEDIQRTLQA